MHHHMSSAQIAAVFNPDAQVQAFAQQAALAQQAAGQYHHSSGLQGALVGGGLGWLLGMFIDGVSNSRQERRQAEERQRLADHEYQQASRILEKGRNRKVYRPDEGGWVAR